MSLITDHILWCFSGFFYKSVKYILKYTVYTVIKYVYINMSLLGKKACNLTFTGYGKVNEQIQLHGLQVKMCKQLSIRGVHLSMT